MMEANYLTIEKISAYNKSSDFSNKIWELTLKWDYFAKDTVGKQLVRLADSISANIAEGFGRYSKKDKIRFYRISLASLEETADWIKKSAKRNLITNELEKEFEGSLEDMRKEIFHLINFTNEKLKF